MAGLLGLGGFSGIGGAKPPAGLLGKYFDPAEMKRQQMKQLLLGAGIGMLTNGKGSTGEVLGNSLGAGLQSANQAGQQYQQHAAIMEWVDKLPPDQQGIAMAFPDKAAEAYLKSNTGGDGPAKVQEYNFMIQNLKSRGVPDSKLPSFQDYSSGSGANNEFGTVPQYGYNPTTGKFGLFQSSKSGGPANEMKLPDGYDVAPPMAFPNLGTTIQPSSQRGGIPLGPALPIDNAGAAAQTAIGTKLGTAAAAAPQDIQAADNALYYVDKLKTDPNREWGTGVSSIFNSIPGTPGKDFQTQVDQATAGAFMTGIQAMRGMGSLSDAEGSRAVAAVTRMSTATSEPAFLQALDDYEAVVKQGRARAEARQAQFGTAIPGQPSQQSIQAPMPSAAPQGGVIKYDAQGNRIQ